MKRIIFLILFSTCFTFAFAQFESTTSKDCYILYDYNGKEFLSNKKIKAGTPITVYGEAKDLETFYEVQAKKIKGYIKENCITITEDMQALLKIKADKLNTEKLEVAKADSLLKANAEKAKIDRYGKWFTHVKLKKVVIGMPEEFIRDCLGSPETVNISEYSFGTHAQYVYKDMYIYTEKGVVTTIQRTSN